MYQIHKQNNEKGYTLLELLIVMLILSYILVKTFGLLDLNYQTVRNELNESEMRQEMKILTTFLIEDLMYSEYVQVYNGLNYDTVQYQNAEGKDVAIKFNHEDGIYEIRNGEEKLVATGEKFNDIYPMVREENGVIIFNFYSRDVNILFDLHIKPRTGGIK